MKSTTYAIPPNVEPHGPCRRLHHATGKLLLVLAGASVCLLAACGSSASGTAQPAVRDSGAAAGGGEAAAGNGEAAGVRYTNAKLHYRVDAPGAMKEQPDGSAAFMGTSERLEVSVITNASAADPKALATSDLRTLGTKPAFQLVNPLSQVTISGQSVEKVVYSWTDGVNPVTSKPNSLVSARYHIPKDRGTLAVVTYTIVANQYDPQGADDVVSTFTWL